MIPLAILRLWKGLRHRDVCISISRIDLGNIQKGRGGRFRVGGNGSKLLMVWNFTSNPPSSATGGFKRECSPYLEVAQVASDSAYQESIPDREVV